MLIRSMPDSEAVKHEKTGNNYEYMLADGVGSNTVRYGYPETTSEIEGESPTPLPLEYIEETSWNQPWVQTTAGVCCVAEGAYEEQQLGCCGRTDVAACTAECSRAQEAKRVARNRTILRIA